MFMYWVSVCQVFFFSRSHEKRMGKGHFITKPWWKPKKNVLSFSIYLFFLLLNVSCVLLSSYITRSRCSCTVFAGTFSNSSSPLLPAALSAHLLDNQYENDEYMPVFVSGHHIPSYVIVQSRIYMCVMFSACSFLWMNCNLQIRKKNSIIRSCLTESLVTFLDEAAVVWKFQ